MLLTPARVQAAAYINRFNGWTNRRYSILEHMVIGTNVLREMGAVPEVQKAFLIHDLEETDFTDIITPVKQRFMVPDYFKAVEAWERELCLEVGLPFAFLTHVDVKLMDTIMLACETHIVSTADWRGFVEDCPEVDVANRMITSGEFQGKHAIKEFWRLMESLA